MLLVVLCRWSVPNALCRGLGEEMPKLSERAEIGEVVADGEQDCLDEIPGCSNDVLRCVSSSAFPDRVVRIHGVVRRRLQ